MGGMSSTKRQKIPAAGPSGTLWVVATPIGNLSDFSDRAKEVLVQSDAILCEDTRRTSQLIAALKLPSKSLERLDQHASDAKIAKILERLQAGESFALVSDAGTPGVSDPGPRLVSRAVESGVSVVPIPGASAVATLFSIAGVEETSFLFRGFFPKKGSERTEELRLASECEITRVFIWFESPNRIVEALESVNECSNSLMGVDSRVFVVAAKEMTKIHEKYFHGDIETVLESVRKEILTEGPKGEWIFLTKFPPIIKEDSKSSEWLKTLECLLAAEVSTSVAVKLVSQYFGEQRNKIYQQALKILEKKS